MKKEKELLGTELQKKINIKEIALRECEERYQSILKISPDAIIIHLDGKIIFANQMALDKIGAKEQKELIGKPAIQFVHPDDREMAIKRIEEMYKSSKPAPLYEERMLKLDGTIIFVEVIATLIPYNNKKATLVILRDISDLKNVESKHKESEDRYGLIFRNSLDALLLSSPDGTIYSANPAACAMFQMSEEEIYMAGRKNLVDPDDKRLVSLLKERERTGKTKGELMMLRKDGTKFPVEFSSTLFYDSKNRLRTSMIIRDITERKEVDEKLQKSYDLLNKLTDQVPGVVYQYRLYPDGSSAFPISSSGMWDIYEVTPEEVKDDASQVFTRIHPDDYDMIVDTINESAKNLTMYHIEFRVILPKQGLRWRLCNAKPERLEDGSTLWYGIITDITERKQAEEELKKYRNQLEDLVKERTADLEKKNTELEKFNDLFVGREFRIKELKNKVEELEQQLKDKEHL